MGLYLSITYKSENYLVERVLPHKTYKILFFHHQKELDDYIFECGIVGCTQQVKGYFIAIVYTSTLQQLNAHSFTSRSMVLSGKNFDKLLECHKHFVKNILSKTPNFYKNYKQKRQKQPKMAK